MKKGFTLIELIAVIIILGVLGLITYPTINNTIKNSKEKALNETIERLKDAAHLYASDNGLEYYKYEKPILFSTLMDNGYIKAQDVKNPIDGNNLNGCILYKWDGNQFVFRYDEECIPQLPTVEITYNVLGDAVNSNGWASSEFYVQVNVDNANSYKWCSTTSDTCTPTALVTENTNTVLISSESTTNKICIQAKNINDEEQSITCSDNYKIDSNLPNIASNSGNYVVVTPTTSINVIDYFNYSSSGSSNIASTSCKNTTSNQDITETSSLAIGDYNIECTATTESGVSNSADITLAISNCFSYSSNGIYNYFCYVGNTDGYREISDVTIPYSINKNLVKTIGTNAFYQKQLTSVTIPSNVTSIGWSAFQSNKLTSVIIPNSVTSIGNGAFDSNQLTSITISNRVTSIGNGAFEGNQLTSVTIPNSVTIIGEFAFSGNQLTSVTIPNSVTSIGTNAFYQNQLTSITIPNSVTNIGSYTFGYNQLTSITIPNSVTSIGGYAFYNNKLTSVIIPDSVTIIGQYVFYNNKLTSVTIPNSVTSIGDFSFAWNQLTSVTIPNSVTSIGNGAFYLNQLTSVTIPENVKSIGSQAFAQNSLVNFTIPANVTNISGNPVEVNNTLTSVTVDSNNLNYKSINNAIYTIDGTKLITGNKNISNSIESSVTEIGSYAFTNCQLTSVTIPNSVTIIDNYAFWGGNQLVSIIIPNGLTSIGYSAFAYNQLTNLTIPNSVTSIGGYAFYQNKLTTVTLGTGLTSVGSRAFDKTSSYNPITTIYNNSGKSFDWTGITSSSTTGQSFVTGTITHQYGNITVTTN